MLKSARPPFVRKPRKRGGPINSMKKLSLVLIALACLPTLAVAQSGQVVEEVITRVNNQIITRSEFERSKDQLKDEVKQDPKDPDKAYADREKDVLRDLIDQQLLLDKGKDLGITGDTDLIKRLDQMRKDMKLESLEDLEKEATKQGYVILKVVDHQMAGIPPLKDILPKIQDALYYQKLQPALRAYLTKLREDAYIKYADGYIDTGKSPNQTQPVETAAAKESDAKKLGKKKHKKLGIL
jgi:hypothetical protein